MRTQVQPRTRLKPANIALTHRQLQQLRLHRELTGESASAAIRRAIDEYLERHDPQAWNQREVRSA